MPANFIMHIVDGYTFFERDEFFKYPDIIKENLHTYKFTDRFKFQYGQELDIIKSIGDDELNCIKLFRNGHDVFSQFDDDRKLARFVSIIIHDDNVYRIIRILCKMNKKHIFDDLFKFE